MNNDKLRRKEFYVIVFSDFHNDIVGACSRDVHHLPYKERYR
ncbi:hypothetical protein HMPREF0083_04968 [Aneurinibacillus aneurinilyticus ATCC 12856]|uniref:Uncharacterized protein n=1 Tax=Aneurinibacillus aneurinilyticus ATCC 12856 TaxID=649747 RepID=U1WEG5_ANEAE|nr:hypothetical protein HMPREF0083_04968 [Aneurinibacillus aneurinilyticus ATCC 12856]